MTPGARGPDRAGCHGLLGRSQGCALTAKPSARATSDAPSTAAPAGMSTTAIPSVAAVVAVALW